MSIDYDAVLAVGKVFDSYDEAEQFFTTKIKLTEKQLAELDRDGFEEFVQSHGKKSWPSGGMINAYTGGEFWLGFGIDTSSIEKYLTSSNYGINTWQKLFGEVPEIINEVYVW